MSSAEQASDPPREEVDASVHREAEQDEVNQDTEEASSRSVGSVKWFSVTKGTHLVPDKERATLATICTL